ncbi:MAG TPA: TatD family hydrolase [Methylomirabilota bacterium]|nr:TatD family hydrolase [Methylomirabilota bacterium]
MNLRYYDAHNHLQDERLYPSRSAILQTLNDLGVERVVVNGSCEEDWPLVAQLAAESRLVIPAFGYHPWYVRERTSKWREALLARLEDPRAVIGEIGLDRWIEDPDLTAQEESFRFQFAIAAERELPVTIHCLKAWGWLQEILGKVRRPERGFLLHSYGGAADLVKPLAKLGAWFSFSGYFARGDKIKKQEAFRVVPLDRLLIETDAPDMMPSEEFVHWRLPNDTHGKPVNHPGNLVSVYEFVARLRGVEVEELAARIEENFRRFFGER